MSTKKSGKSESAKSEVRISVADQLRELTIETSLDRDEVLENKKKSWEKFKNEQISFLTKFLKKYKK